MESKRFEVIASTKELTSADGKNAVRIELQYGKDGAPTELVIAELYQKDGKWAYTRSQVRIECTAPNVQHVLTCSKEMYESSKKVEKKASTKVDKLTSAIETMSDDEKNKLLALLIGKAKEESTPTVSKTEKKAPKEATDDGELVLSNFLAKIDKKPIKK